MRISAVSLLFSSAGACPDSELGRKCTDECESTLMKCLGDCTTGDCNSQCLREHTDCNNGCPCGENCPNGCEHCDHELCKSKKAVLVLNKGLSTLIKNNGKVEERMQFSYGEDAVAHHSCSTVFKGEFYVFGGKSPAFYESTVSKIIDCTLTKIGRTDYPFYNGACNTFKSPHENVLLCFGHLMGKSCLTFDNLDDDGWGLIEGTNIGESIYLHHETSLGNWQNHAVALGGLDGIAGPPLQEENKGSRFEWLNMDKIPSSPSDLNWVDKGYGTIHCQSIAHYDMVTTSSNIFIIGGLCQYQSNVPSSANLPIYYPLEDRWHYTLLKKARSGARGIMNGNRLFVVGGDLNFESETFEYNATNPWNVLWFEDFVEPKLHYWDHYPELFLVDEDFCVPKV